LKIIIHQKNIDYIKNCKYTFGTFVQAHNKMNKIKKQCKKIGQY
jgi:hypothetical protein